MARLALISDVHLGTRQYGLKERYEDFLAAFRRPTLDKIAPGAQQKEARC